MDSNYPAYRLPAQPLPPLYNEVITIHTTFEEVKVAIETAYSLRDQLEVCCGIPLIFNTTTQRYTLAPSAEEWFNFRLYLINNLPSRTPPVLDLSKSTLMMRRKNQESKK
jgi:hypothetical protein